MRDTRPMLATVLLVLALTAGCAAGDRAPAIRTGTPCVRCGMSVENLRFACEQRRDGRWRVYDSIECLLADGVAERVLLSDYDTETLHAAESLWIVQGSFPSPMGGGLAAFADRSAANDVAANRNGRVSRLPEVRR